MMLSVAVVCLLFQQVHSIVNNEGYLDVSAFNIQIFGQNKMKNPLVQDVLVKIILRYDLVLVQEIRDSSGEAIVELMNLLKQKDDRYDYVISGRLGRSSSKEQYAYIYRSDWLTPVTEFVYDDVDDVFEREPFVVQFKSSRASISNFVCIGIHTKPSDAAAEISNLVKVYDHVVANLKINDVILMGDFNGACDYVKSFADVALATDPRFYWLVTDKMDTTTGNTDCAYDRFVVAGENMLKGVVLGSTGVFHFDQTYHLNTEQMKDVSDHYPIQVQFFSKSLEYNVQREEELVVKDKLIDDALVGNYRKIYSMRKLAEEKGYEIELAYTSSGAYLEIKVNKKAVGTMNAVNSLRVMQGDFPEFVSKDQVYTGERWIVANNPVTWLPQGFGKYQTLYNYYLTLPPQHFIMTLLCSLKDKSNPTCVVFVDRE